MVIVAEYKDTDYLDDLSISVKSRVNGEIGIEPYDVVFVERGSLPKTSSGKHRRSKTKRAYESGALSYAKKRY